MTPTQIIKILMKDSRVIRDVRMNNGMRYLRLQIGKMMTQENPPWGVVDLVAIIKRLKKKLRQPHRRKERGPLRAKAVGKNEVRGVRF